MLRRRYRRGLDAARDALRTRQRTWAEQLGFESDQDVYQLARNLAKERQDAMVLDGEYLRESVFRFPVDLERQRWAELRAIMDRVHPGPDEDANYFNIVGRQAATLQAWLLGHTQRRKKVEDLTSRILLGTTGEPRSHAAAERVGAFVYIVMSAGMIDFLYQTAKAVVLSWKVNDAPDGWAVSYSSREEDTAEELSKNTYPIDLMHDTLSTWLYEGFPRAPHAATPAAVYHPALSLLITMAERSVIGHEYGHAFMDHFPSEQIDPRFSGVKAPTGPWERELRADAFSFVALNDTAAEYDGTPSPISLQGAALSFKAHEIFERALGIALRGDDTIGASSTHPPFSTRLDLLRQMFIEGHPEPTRAEDDLVGVLVPSRTADQLWARVAPRLEGQHRARRQLHSIWRTSLDSGVLP